MGYRAQSARAVYEYLFSVDPRPTGLTDRFNWSILVVNDYSSTSSRLLRLHAQELCARTADRVRFAFFTGTSRPRAEPAPAPDRSMATRLRRLLRPNSFAEAGQDRLDFEDLDWRELRPVVLRPLRGPHEIAVAIDDHDDIHTSATPAAEEAALFAQRLGIGRHLPCLVMFTDVGERRVHVLPLAHRHPNEVRVRLLHWIDTYYERNRAALERWSSVEDDVLRLVREARTSLNAVRSWPDRRRSDLRWLACVSGLAQDLHATHGDLPRILGDHTAPVALREVVGAFRTAMVDCDRQEELGRRYAELARLALAAPDRHDLRSVLTRDIRSLPPDARDLLRNAATKVAPLPPPATLPGELMSWWRHTALPTVSRRQFRAWCAELLPHLPDVVGAPREWRDNYATFRGALGAVRLTATDEDASAGIVAALATCQPAEVWRDSAALLGPVITEALRHLRLSAPGWLAHCAPQLTYGGALPIGSRDDTATMRQFIDASATLSTMTWVRDTTVQGEIVEQVRRMVVQDLLGLARVADTVPAVRADALIRAKADLGRVHTELATQLDRAVDEGPPSVTDPRALTALAAALDDYEAAVAAIWYPHMYDPEVIEVRTPRSPLQASGATRHAVPDAAHRLRGALTDVVTSSAEVEVLREGALLTANELRAVLRAGRGAPPHGTAV
ncbi:hypothetical protein AB0M43_13805 [Longispora sp. NPDC051575]|uniref:hypothetical protein n=1 Tax=Longispora sp. NPDC051575 TaxID=3154943 RepID=UPI00341F4EAC